MIEVKRAPHRPSVDGDHATGPADGLPWKGKKMLQKRQAPAQVIALGEELCEGFWRFHQDKVTDMKRAGRTHEVETDRHTGTGVPEQPWDGTAVRGYSD